MNIQGKLAFVTGSAKRIGRAIAVELAKRGATVGIHHRARNSEPDAIETLRLVREAGGNGEVFQAELTDVQQVKEMFEDVRDAFGRLHILVNSASVFSPASPADTTEDLWNEQMDSNAKAPFFVAQHAARLMSDGKIINIADVAGEVIWPGYFAYSVSKAAVRMVTKAFSLELAPFNIQVNTIAPGPISTKMLDSHWFHLPPEEAKKQKQEMSEMTPMGRIGDPDEIAGAAVYLASDASSYTTGTGCTVVSGALSDTSALTMSRD